MIENKIWLSVKLSQSPRWLCRDGVRTHLMVISNALWFYNIICDGIVAKFSTKRNVFAVFFKVEKISILWYHLSPKISVFCEAVANYITKLRGLKRARTWAWTFATWVANYITKLRGLKHFNHIFVKSVKAVANYITKLRGLKQKLC